MDRRNFLRASLTAPLVKGSAGRMKSATMRFSQVKYYSTGEKCPKESPAEQFDNWRNEKKRDVLAISLGERLVWEPLPNGFSFTAIGDLSYIDVLYQIPEKDWQYGGEE